MMDQLPLVLWSLLLILLQVFHIFEEIGGEAYELAGSLKKYLLVASALVTFNVAFLALIVLDLRVGYYLGIMGAVIAILNGGVHLVGYAKTRSHSKGVGAGVFTGIPLAITGMVVLYLLAGAILA